VDVLGEARQSLTVVTEMRFEAGFLGGEFNDTVGELDGSGDELDVRAALLDLITYNDGKPLSCCA
jgi:hypothetical protein